MLRRKIVIVREKFSRKGCVRIFQSSKGKKGSLAVDLRLIFVSNPSARSAINSEINLEDGEHVLRASYSLVHTRYLRDISWIETWHIRAIFISRNIIAFK